MTFFSLILSRDWWDFKYLKLGKTCQLINGYYTSFIWQQVCKKEFEALLKYTEKLVQCVDGFILEVLAGCPCQVLTCQPVIIHPDCKSLGWARTTPGKLLVQIHPSATSSPFIKARLRKKLFASYKQGLAAGHCALNPIAFILGLC